MDRQTDRQTDRESESQRESQRESNELPDEYQKKIEVIRVKIERDGHANSGGIL